MAWSRVGTTLKQYWHLAVPTAIGIALGAAWQAYEHQLPDLRFTLGNETTIYVDPSGGELHRQSLVVWHLRDEPVTNVTLTLSGPTAARLASARRNATEATLVPDSAGAILLAPSLRSQERASFSVDASRSLSVDDLSITSDQLLGSKHVRWWTGSIARQVIVSAIYGLMMGTLALVAFNWLSGGNLYQEVRVLLAKQADAAATLQSAILEMQEIISETARTRAETRRLLVEAKAVVDDAGASTDADRGVDPPRDPI